MKLSKVFGSKKHTSKDAARRNRKTPQKMVAEMEMSCSTATASQMSENLAVKHSRRSSINAGSDNESSNLMRSSPSSSLGSPNQILAQPEHYGSMNEQEARKMFSALRKSNADDEFDYDDDDDDEVPPFSEIQFSSSET